jgi:magnesium-transporting ATPase (P-type)
MLESWLIIFIIVTLIMLIITIFMIEEQPYMAIPFIMIGMIFSVLCAYGVWNVEWAVLQNDNTFVIESTSYGEPYSYVFVLIFLIFMMLFIKAGFNTWQQALQEKAEMEYNRKMRRRGY